MNQKDQMFKYKQPDAQGAVTLEESKGAGKVWCVNPMQKLSGPKKKARGHLGRNIKTSNEGVCFVCSIIKGKKT